MNVAQQAIHTLGKSERLKSRKQIEQLFQSGKSFHTGFFKVFHQCPETDTVKSTSCLQFGVAVGTRHFKQAVKRNRIKRLMREAYRLQKQELELLLQQQNKTLNLFFIFTGKEVPSYELVFETTTAVLQKLYKLYQ
jgi:ribonuclease P protein component